MTSQTAISGECVCVCVYVCVCVCVCEAPLCDLVLLSPQERFRPHVFQTMNSRVELGKHLTVPPCLPPFSLYPSLHLSFSSCPPCFPASHLTSPTTSHPVSFYVSFSRLSDLISRSGAFIPPQREDRFSSA